MKSILEKSKTEANNVRDLIRKNKIISDETLDAFKHTFIRAMDQENSENVNWKIYIVIVRKIIDKYAISFENWKMLLKTKLNSLWEQQIPNYKKRSFKFIQSLKVIEQCTKF